MKDIARETALTYYMKLLNTEIIQLTGGLAVCLEYTWLHIKLSLLSNLVILSLKLT